MNQIIGLAADFANELEIRKNPVTRETLSKTMGFLAEECIETGTAINKHMMAEENGGEEEEALSALDELVDGFGDVAFVALNGIYKTLRWQGKNHEDAKRGVFIVMESICMANLDKKQPDGSVRVVDGKIQKPSDWKPPCHKALFKPAGE